MTVNDLLDAIVILQNVRDTVTAESTDAYNAGNHKRYLELNRSWGILASAINKLFRDVMVLQGR